MKCTVCQRELAPDLSMCVRCGAMKNDSVREELEMSLTPISAPLKFRPVESREEPTPAVAEAPEPKVSVRRSATSDLAIKNTSPTLADFVHKNAAIPEWRLKLQNTVRQRAGRGNADAISPSVATEPVSNTRTNGANALKVKYEEQAAAPETDEKLTNALKRIELSRRAYLGSEKAREGIRVAKEAQRKFPYSVVSRSEDLPELPAKPTVETAPTPKVRPKLVSSLRIEKKEYDTNKLIPIPEAARMASSFDEAETPQDTEPKAPFKENWSQRIEIREDAAAEESTLAPAIDPSVETEIDEIDDLAPIAMRFNAGLFDLIIGSFATFVLLSPLFAWSEGWFSLSGTLLFATVLLLVMFLYLTATIAFMGQTFGMKIFSLELIDAEKSEFPTIHQAAVNSAVFLFSLVFAGLGFIPMAFNEERRAAHDLISGTILVREV